jgi:DNA-binding NarL/FixJ family response regulator
MINLESAKVTPRDQQGLNLLVQGCSNKEIAGQPNISPRTVKQRLTPKEIQIAILVWEGLTNREIGRIIGTSEQVIKNHL